MAVPKCPLFGDSTVYEQVCVFLSRTTVEPPNKGHFGDDINSAGLFFVEGCLLWDSHNVL